MKTKAERILEIHKECLGNCHAIAKISLGGTFFTAILCGGCLAKIRAIEAEDE